MSDTKVEFVKIPIELKKRRRKERLKWLKIFCISNFHYKTRFTLGKWIKSYQLSNLSSDIIAGSVTAFIMVVQALAISLVMNVPGDNGLYSSLFGGFINFFFGTSKDVSIGPSLLAGVMLARFNTLGSPIIASLIAFFNGIVFLIMSFFNMGFLMEFISYPVLTGWITSGAVTIFINQLPSWFGLKISKMADMSSYELFGNIIINIKLFMLGDLLVGSLSFFLCSGFYFLGPLITRKLSQTKQKGSFIFLTFLKLIIVARVGWIIILFSFISQLLETSTSLHGSFTFLRPGVNGLPTPLNPFQSITTNNGTISLVQILSEIYPTFYLGPIVILIETLAGARNFGKHFGYQVDNNQEFMCLGITNVLNSFFRGYPVGGALARTSINALSGSKSLLCGLITSILLIPTMLFLMPYFKYVSKASLGACICSAVLTQIQISSLKNLYRIKKIELLPWFATFLSGLYKLEVGMLVGFVVSAAFIMFRELRPRIHSSFHKNNETLTLIVKGALHFPGAYSLSTRMRTVKKSHPNVKILIIDCSNMYETDISVVEEMREAVIDVEKNGLVVIIKHLKQGAVHDLVFNAGLQSNVLRGMRHNSCIVEFHKTHHMIPFYDNPRDLLESTTSLIIEEDKDELEENSDNYLYSVRSAAGIYFGKTV